MAYNMPDLKFSSVRHQIVELDVETLFEGLRAGIEPVSPAYYQAFLLFRCLGQYEYRWMVIGTV